MVSRRGLGIGLILAGAGAAVGLALLLQPVQAGGTNLCANVNCQAGYLCDPATGNCVAQNPGSTTFTLTISSVNSAGAPVSGPVVTLDQATSKQQNVTLPASVTLSSGGHSIIVPGSQIIGNFLYTFIKWGDLSTNNTVLSRAINLNADLTIQAVFTVVQLATVTLLVEVRNAQTGAFSNLNTYISLDGNNVIATTMQLAAGSTHTVTALTPVIAGGTTSVDFYQWSDGVLAQTRSFVATDGLTLKAQYCCILGGTFGVTSQGSYPFQDPCSPSLRYSYPFQPCISPVFVRTGGGITNVRYT